MSRPVAKRCKSTFSGSDKSGLTCKNIENLAHAIPIFVFYKGYRYEDELGSRKIATVPPQWCQKACWYFLMFTE
jgi:hypothetical protein